MPDNPFIKDHLYKRSRIHEWFGGNPQSGISTSSKFPYIFIFSGTSGLRHGYKDQWENKDVFSYTGEGQAGDMKFTRGNLALIDHVRSGRRVFLFTQQRASVRFESELELVDIDFFSGLDRNDKERKAIKFFFKRAGIALPYTLVNLHPALVEEAAPGYIFNLPNVTERSGLVTSRVGQGAYRKSILFRWDFKCAVTGYPTNDILIASHIVPWKGATDQERLDVNNGILLSPAFDALFDQHLISFENSGRIILPTDFEKTNYSLLGITGYERIQNFNQANYAYLERHWQMLSDNFVS